MIRLGRLVATPLIVLGLAVASTAQAADPGLTDTTIRIGQFGALTGPGYFTGKLVIDGADIVYKEANKAGGINGRKIELVRQDDRCDPATAIGAVKKLIFDDNIFVIHGGGCSNASIGAYPEIKDSKVPWVIFASVADSLTVPTVPTIYTTALTATIESASQLAFALQKGAKRIAVISTRDAWGRGRYDAVMEEFRKKGIKPVADEELGADANDATPQALRIQQADADAVLLVLFPKAGATFLRDAAKIGLAPVMIGTTAMGDLPVLAKQVGTASALDKMFAISHVRHMPEDEAMSAWRKLFVEYYPGETMSIYHLLGIASAEVVVEGLKRSGRDLSREAFTKQMDALTNFESPVFPGPINCTPTDHQCHKHAAFVQLVNGRIATVATTSLAK